MIPRRLQSETISSMVTFSYASSLGITDAAGLASASASVDAMRVMIRDATARGRVRDDWNASMLVGAEMERRRERAKAFLLKDGMLIMGGLDGDEQLNYSATAN